MIIGINGSNIGSVGGINHVVQLIHNYSDVYYKNKINKIIIWASPKLYIALKNLNSSKILIINLKKNNLLFHFLWKIFFLNYNLKKFNCDILFALDGIILRSYKHTVLFYQNLIPFDYQAMLSFGISLRAIKNILVSYLYLFSSKLCNNFVVLNNYGKKLIQKKIGKLKNVSVVPHGVSKKFFNIRKYSKKKKIINLIYVSPIDFYKHQWNVIQAVNELNKKKIFHLKLHIVGAVSDSGAFKLMMESMDKANLSGKKIFYYGNKGENYIRKIIKKSDIYLFASSCESFGLTLVEGMASGCFLLASDKSGMKKTTNNLAVYFDPYDVHSIKNSIRKFINLRDLNIKKKIYNVQQAAKQFNWADSFQKLYFFFDRTLKSTKDRKSKITFSTDFIKKEYLKNLFIFSYSINYFFPMFLFYLLFFIGQKKISIEYSIMLSGITFLIHFLSFNLRNLIITDKKNYIFLSWFGIAFRFITSIIIILISNHIMQGYYFQSTFLYIALAVSLSSWIKELILAFFERKNFKTIEIILQLSFIIFTSVFCFLFIYYKKFFFLELISLYLVIDILLRILIVLFYFKKTSLIFLKDLGKIFRIPLVSFAFYSGIFLTLLNFVIRISIDQNFEIDAAAYYIFLLSIAVLPGSLVSGVIGASYLKNERSYPFSFSLLMHIYLLMFFLGIIFELLKIEYALNYNTSIIFFTGLLSTLGQSIRQLNIINIHRIITAFKNDVIFSVLSFFLLFFFIYFFLDYFIFYIFIITLILIYLNLNIKPIK